MKHLKKIRDLLDAGHAEQASALIETLDDSEIDATLVGEIATSELALPLLPGKYTRLRHPALSGEAMWQMLARTSAPAARELLDRLDRCTVDLGRVGLLAKLESSVLVVLGCRLSKQGAHPPYGEIDAEHLPDLRVRELTLVGFDFEGARASVGPSVNALSLFACQNVVLGDAPALEHLAYTADEAATSVRVPPNLVSLQIDHAPRLKTLSGLDAQPRLDRIVLRGDPSLADLSGFSKVSTLTRVELQLSGLTSVDWLRDATLLSHLQLAGCERLESITALADRSLEHLSLAGCAALRSLEGMPRLPTQDLLDLSGCAELRDLGPLIDRAPALVALDLRGCHGLASLEPLETSKITALALANTGFTPERVSASLRDRCTWAAKPKLAMMAAHA